MLVASSGGIGRGGRLGMGGGEGGATGVVKVHREEALDTKVSSVVSSTASLAGSSSP